MESSKKGREAIRLRPTSVEVGGGYHRLRDPPWGVKSSSHILGTTAMGFNTGKRSPLSWFENNYKKVRLFSYMQECMYMLVHSQEQHGGSRLKTAWSSDRLVGTTPACNPAHTRCLFQPLLLQHCFPLGWTLPFPKRVHIYIEEMKPAWTQPSGLFLQPFGPQPPHKVVTVTEHRISLSSHLDLALALPHIKVAAVSTPKDKTWPMRT